MRVVDVTQWYSPTSGGIRTYLHAKAGYASAAGVGHAAIVPGARSGEDMVSGSRFVSLRGATPTRRWGYRVVLRAGAFLAALEELDPDVVVLHDVFCHPRAVRRWADGRGVGVAMVVHGDARLAARGLPRAIGAPAEAGLSLAQRRALSVPDTVIVTSRASGSRVAGLTRRPPVLSPLGVDLGGLGAARPDPTLRCALAPGGEPLLAYVGRISTDKRVDLLPPMLAALPDGVLAIAGTGAGVSMLARQFERLGVAHRVRLLGHLGDRARIGTLLASADCFVHPNPEEPYGLAPLEALAAGCRVVAPDAEGSRETLDGRGAVLVTPDDPVALAEGVRRALALPRPRPDLSALDWSRTFEREWEAYAGLARAA